MMTEEKKEKAISEFIRREIGKLGEKLQKQVDKAAKDLKKVNVKRREFIGDKQLLSYGVVFAIGLAVGVALAKKKD